MLAPHSDALLMLYDRLPVGADTAPSLEGMSLLMMKIGLLSLAVLIGFGVLSATDSASARTVPKKPPPACTITAQRHACPRR